MIDKTRRDNLKGSVRENNPHPKLSRKGVVLKGADAMEKGFPNRIHGGDMHRAGGDAGLIVGS